MKVAIVTGASRGIGRACAIRLAQDGFTVVINYAHSDAEAQKVLDTVRENGGDGMLCRADVSKVEEVRAMMRDVSKAYGQIDVLVNNAGIVRDEYLLMLTPETLDRCMDLNVKGYLYCAQQAVLKMFRKKSGAIINMSSVSGLLALPVQRDQGRGQLDDADHGEGACPLRHPRQRGRARLHRNRNAGRPARREEEGIP